jgi:hypothetical protein
MSGGSEQNKSGRGRKGESGTELGSSKRTQCSNCRGLGAAVILFEVLIVSQGYLLAVLGVAFGFLFSSALFLIPGPYFRRMGKYLCKLTRHGCVNVDKMTQSGVGPQWSVKVPQKALLD